MKSKMSVIIMVLCAGWLSLAYAHPPSDIHIAFDPSTKLLTAVIVHNVSNTLNHFIIKVDIGVNDKEVLTQKISQQDTNENQTVIYRIPDAKEGDVLSVEAYCSISGMLEKKIKVTK